MADALSTPQQIGPNYDVAVLRSLSEAQNGASSIQTETDGDKVTGYTSLLNIDLSGYAAAAAGALAALKSRLKGQIDAKAEELRMAFITPGFGQVMEYQEAYAQANAVLAATGDVKASDYPMLAATVGVDIDPDTGKPATDVLGVARSVKAAYEAFLTAGAAIRSARLKGKAAIDAAGDAGTAQTAFDAIAWPKLT